MQFSAEQLKEKLLRGLDKDNNVVDMPAVLDVLSSLEKLQVTKDLLEATRLGKYVNEMRKRTSNRDLSKRAKNLVRRWQVTVLPQAAKTPAHYNGDKLAVHPNHIKKLDGNGIGSNPASPASRPGTPSAVAGHSAISSAHFRTASSSPALYSLNNSNNGGSHISGKSNHQTNTLTPTSSYPSFVGVKNNKKRPGSDVKCDLPQKKMLITPSDVQYDTVINGGDAKFSEYGSQSTVKSKMDYSSKNKCGANDVTPQRLNRAHSSLPLDRSNSMSSLHSAKSEPVGNKTPVILKTPKVKTTAQLLEEMASSGNINVKNSATVKKIALNQIDKERDDDTPVIPVNAKPRTRKKPRYTSPPQTNDKTLNETKNEMVHKFLETAMPPSQHPNADFELFSQSSNVQYQPEVGDESPNVLSIKNKGTEFLNSSSRNSLHLNTPQPVKNSNSTSKRLLQMVTTDEKSLVVKFTLGDINDSSAKEDKDKHDHSKNTSALDPWALLPPLDNEPIDWKSLDYVPSTNRVEVNDETVNRLHTEHWLGVNGNYDYCNEWRNWTQPTSVPSYNGDLLHILPYVVLDDFDEEVLPDIDK